MDQSVTETVTETAAPSKFKTFIGHPVTVEVLRFTGYLAVTIGGKWALGKAAKAYRQSKADKQLPAQQPQQHNAGTTTAQVS